MSVCVGIQEHTGYPRPVPRQYGTDRQQQQLKDEIPPWLKMDTVVAVRNAHSPDPVTGAVKFIGHVDGWDELVAGLELVSCMCILYVLGIIIASGIDVHNNSKFGELHVPCSSAIWVPVAQWQEHLSR